MRKIGALGIAAVLMACSGGGESPEAPVAAPAEPVAAPVATEGSGTRHEVQMVLEGTDYRFVPAALTIRTGDVVVFRGVSGAFHNVEFWPDSLPANSRAALSLVVPNRMSDLATNLINEGDSLVFTFTGVPAGRYPFFCLPHQAMNMTGVLTITE